MNNDLTPAEWGAQLNPPMSERRAQHYYKQKRIRGAYERAGRIWIPKNAPDPRRPVGYAGHLRTIRLRRLAEARERRQWAHLGENP